MKNIIYYIILPLIIVSCIRKEANTKNDQEGIEMIATFNKKDTVLTIEYVNKTDTNYYFIGNRFSFVDKKNTGYFFYPVLSRKINRLEGYESLFSFSKIEGSYDLLSMITLNKKIDSIYPSRCNYVPENNYGIGNDSILICLFDGICIKKKSKVALLYKFSHNGDILNNQFEYAVRSEMSRDSVLKHRLKALENMKLQGYYPYKKDVYIRDTLKVKYD
ncbi:hypothetical protein [Apibacter sp. HY039]|uniref:hypothetical protein n=1 Tax=Apibacter sp. HY039 TaxID=2501476 RepID=UPI000FEBE8AF|nr:hypothetical protein [Apibacter sp. HY039]